MVSFHEVHYVERLLDAIGVTQRELIVFILLIMAFMIGYTVKALYRFKSECRNISCDDIKNMKESSREVLVIVRKMSDELKDGNTETSEYIRDLNSAVGRLEDSIIDLRTKSYELSGVIFSLSAVPGRKNRIMHNED